MQQCAFAIDVRPRNIEVTAKVQKQYLLGIDDESLRLPAFAEFVMLNEHVAVVEVVTPKFRFDSLEQSCTLLFSTHSFYSEIIYRFPTLSRYYWLSIIKQ